MFNETIRNKETLIRTMDALDALGKSYTMTKTMSSEPQEEFSEQRGDVTRSKRYASHTYECPLWTVTEIPSQVEDKSLAVGRLKASVDFNTSGLAESLDKLREFIGRPLSDFITVQVDSGNASQD